MIEQNNHRRPNDTMTDNLAIQTKVDPESLPNKKAGKARLNLIYECLRDRICLFNYPPGTLLREAELATEFGVSRTPIRQILQRLEAEQFVDIRDGVGTIVTGVDFACLKDVYELRLKLAEIIGDLSPRSPTESDLEVMTSLLQRAAVLREKRDLTEFWRVQNERHRVINFLIGNEVLRMMHDRLYFQTARMWYGIVDQMWAEATQELQAEIEELLRALKAADTRAVALVSRNYIAYSRARLAQYFNPR
jgi:DNA-binding GntR family transcriptional regulator